MDVHATGGHLPRFWDRQVIFIANLLSLFYGNGEETDVLRAEVGPLESYGGRLIPILSTLFCRHPNILILEQAPDADLLTYFSDRLNVPLPQIEILSHDQYTHLVKRDGSGDAEAGSIIRRLESHAAEWLDGFVTDETLAHFARRMGKSTICSVTASWKGNNKLLLHEYLNAKHLPVFDTHVVEHPNQLDKCLNDLRDLGYMRAAIKAQIGASGIGLTRIDFTRSHVVPDYLFHEGRCLVQGWLDEDVDGVTAIGSPSVQFFVEEDHLTLYDVTEQILSSESIHEGNISPPPCLAGYPEALNEILRQSSIAGEWLHDLGYRGTGSIDFHAIQRRGAIEIRICEINARVTGATYPAVLARRFHPQGAWLMRNIRFISDVSGRGILRTLERNQLLYHLGQANGVLPINFNSDSDGNTVKGQFLCMANTPDQATQLLKEACEVLPVDWTYDRD